MLRTPVRTAGKEGLFPLVWENGGDMFIQENRGGVEQVPSNCSPYSVPRGRPFQTSNIVDL